MDGRKQSGWNGLDIFLTILLVTDTLVPKTLINDLAPYLSMAFYKIVPKLITYHRLKFRKILNSSKNKMFQILISDWLRYDSNDSYWSTLLRAVKFIIPPLVRILIMESSKKKTGFLYFTELCSLLIFMIFSMSLEFMTPNLRTPDLLDKSIGFPFTEYEIVSGLMLPVLVESGIIIF